MAYINDLVKREILIKENEKFQFRDIGFIVDVDSAVDSFCSNYANYSDNDDFVEFRRRFLEAFYSEYGFGEFIAKRIDSAEVAMLGRQLMRKALGMMRKGYDGDSIDDVLRMRDNTIAFFISRQLFVALYPEFVNAGCTAKTPYGFFGRCREFVGERFPLSFVDYFTRLRLNDREMWDKTYCVIKRQVLGVTNSKNVSLSDRENAVDNITNDTFMFLSDKVRGGDDVDFKDAMAFKSYIYRIGSNKLKEMFRKDKKDDMIDNVEFTDEIPYTCDEVREEIVDFMDVDVENDFEVANAISILLCDETQPLRSRIIGEDAEKVELFMMKYVDGKDYDEIIDLKYGGVSSTERKRLYDGMRQNMVRIRGRLISNFKKVLNDERKKLQGACK